MTPANVPALPGSTPPFLVGREREQAILRDHLAATLGGHGGLVLIAGEAGIGKTALAEALCREATAHGALVLVGRCYDLSETPPYGPWLELFGRYHPDASLPPLPPVFARRGVIGQVANQTALFQQVQEFLAAAGAQQPLVILAEDFHWSDQGSLDLLRFLARMLATLPILILVTYRSDEITRRHPLYSLLPLLVRESSAARIDLGRLSDDALRALVADRYHCGAADGARLVSYLHERAEGNALFTAELLLTLEERGIVRENAEGWRVGNLGRVAVPMLLRQVIDGRVARLGEEAQQLLAVAAVIGQEVPLALWAAVAAVPEERVLAAVDQVMEAHLVAETADGLQVAFVHALIREALYEGILPSRRRIWHRKVGETLVALPDPDPDSVAHHFQQAGDERAAEWLIKAGERAHRAYARLTAAARYEAALALMEKRPQETSERGWLLYRLGRALRYSNTRQGLAYLDEAARVAGVISDEALAAITLQEQGFLHMIAGEFDRGFAEMSAGADACEALSAEEQDRINRYEKGGNLSHLRGTLINSLADTGRYRDALAMGETFFAAFPTTQEERGAGASSYGDGWAGFALAHAMLGHPTEALEASARAIEVYRIVEHHSILGCVLADQLNYVWLPYYSDRTVARQKVAEETENAWARAVGAVNDLPPGWATMPLAILRGDWAAARAMGDGLPETSHGVLLLEEARASFGPLARDQGEADLAWDQVHALLPDGAASPPGNNACYYRLLMQRLAASLAMDVGDLVTARAWLEAHDRWLAWSGAVLGRSEGQALWARYHRQAADPDNAYAHARHALSHAIEPRQPLALLAAYRLLGALDTEAGRYEEAATHLDAALALADACAAPFERALTLLARAELHAATGRRKEALALLDEVRAICMPLDAQPTLARVDALATRLAAPHAGSPAFPAGLSAREVEVLRLVAAGRTNREIADTLFLSPGTINVHVTHILTKTNTANRAEAAAFAQRHGLA